MMWPPVYTVVIQRPVACLDRRRVMSREARRRSRFGKATLDDKLSGRMTPKQMRQAGL